MPAPTARVQEPPVPVAVGPQPLAGRTGPRGGRAVAPGPPSRTQAGSTPVMIPSPCRNGVASAWTSNARALACDHGSTARSHPRSGAPVSSRTLRCEICPATLPALTTARKSSIESQDGGVAVADVTRVDAPVPPDRSREMLELGLRGGCAEAVLQPGRHAEGAGFERLAQEVVHRRQLRLGGVVPADARRLAQRAVADEEREVLRRAEASPRPPGIRRTPATGPAPSYAYDRIRADYGRRRRIRHRCVA